MLTADETALSLHKFHVFIKYLYIPRFYLISSRSDRRLQVNPGESVESRTFQVTLRLTCDMPRHSPLWFAYLVN